MPSTDELLALGARHYRARAIPEAESCYREIIAKEPENAAAWCGLGVVLQGQKRFDEAMACYGKALNAKPGYVNALNNLGTAYHEQWKLQDAIDWYRRALTSDPN